jgi:hypothetical protein
LKTDKTAYSLNLVTVAILLMLQMYQSSLFHPSDFITLFGSMHITTRTVFFALLALQFITTFIKFDCHPIVDNAALLRASFGVTMMIMWYWMHHVQNTFGYLLCMAILLVCITLYYASAWEHVKIETSTAGCGQYSAFSMYIMITLVISQISGFVWVEWLALAFALCAQNILLAIGCNGVVVTPISSSAPSTPHAHAHSHAPLQN